jgi:uncharacterized protein YcnI
MITTMNTQQTGQVGRLRSGLMLALGLSTAFAAAAHVTVANPKATAGSYVKVVLQVPHGCAGSATQAITVTVPPELLVAKPMPKAGWSLVTETAPLAQPVQLHGKPVLESTSLVRWEGGRLPNGFFDEFVVFGKLADGARGKVAFKTLQTCDKSEVDWSGEAGSASPAPTLLVEPAAPGAAGHVHPQ